MSFIHDRQARYYCYFLLDLIALIFGAGICLVSRRTAAVREMFLAHDNAVATSLLEQGVSREIIATALSNTDTSAAGKQLLAVIGLSHNKDINRLSYVSFVRETVLPPLWGAGLLLGSLMIAGAVLFLCGRERLYKESQSIFRNYIDGDYTLRLPQTSEGTVYWMLASVDQLATMLQAQKDTDRKAKEFLKNTISDISHQLKTPLAALMMYQEIMESEPDHPDTIKVFCAKTVKGTGLMVYVPQSGIDAGDVVTLHLNGGSTDMEIVGLLSDCPFNSRTDVDRIVCSEDTFRQLTGETDYTIIDIQLSRSATESDVNEIRGLAGPACVFADARMGNSSTRGAYYCFGLFIYGFLVLIGLITIFNIVNSIAMSVAARIKQYGAFRAIGLSSRQLVKMIVAEASAYAVTGCIFGSVLGLMSNRFLFNYLVSSRWGSPWEIPIAELGIIIAVVTIAVLLAVSAPVRKIREMSIVDTISAL